MSCKKLLKYMNPNKYIIKIGTKKSHYFKRYFVRSYAYRNELQRNSIVKLKSY
uniref:Uncharacterized protein n=1 Tax=Ciona intestinalis TaxID=7719 RepID=H2XQS2_CIOIN